MVTREIIYTIVPHSHPTHSCIYRNRIESCCIKDGGHLRGYPMLQHYAPRHQNISYWKMFWHTRKDDSHYAGQLNGQVHLLSQMITDAASHITLHVHSVWNDQSNSYFNKPITWKPCRFVCAFLLVSYNLHLKSKLQI